MPLDPQLTFSVQAFSVSLLVVSPRSDEVIGGLLSSTGVLGASTLTSTFCLASVKDGAC